MISAFCLGVGKGLRKTDMASSNSTITAPSEAFLQEYSGHILIAVSVALMVLEILCVGLHFVARRLSMTATGLDDWLIGPSFVFCFGLTVISICMCSKAFIPLKELLPSRQGSFELQMLHPADSLICRHGKICWRRTSCAFLGNSGAWQNCPLGQNPHGY